MNDVTRFHNLKWEYEAALRKAEAEDASDEDINAAMECCRRFKIRCIVDRTDIPQKLDDPTRAGERALLEQVYKEASEYLPKLEARCPGDGGDPLPGPPARRFL